MSSSRTLLNHSGYLEHLGFIVDLKEDTFVVPQRRITALQHKLAYFQTSSKTTARKLASLAGTIISIGLSLRTCGNNVDQGHLQSH